MIYPTSAPTSTLIAPTPSPRVRPQPTIALTLGITLLSTLLMPSWAHADEDKAPTSGRSTGSRGCSTVVASNDLMAAPAPAKVPALILLAPSQPIGQTVSSRPTFAWFVRDRASVPLEFRIYEQTKSGYTLIKEIKDESFLSVPGIMVLSPLHGLPELTPGKRYRWQVELVCNPARPSGNPFAEAEVNVVPLPPLVQQKLSAAQSPQRERARLNQAQIYAQADLWYDALATVLPSPQDSTAVATFLQSLLDRIAVNPAEQQMLRQSTISPTRPLAAVQP